MHSSALGLLSSLSIREAQQLIKQLQDRHHITVKKPRVINVYEPQA